MVFFIKFNIYNLKTYDRLVVLAAFFSVELFTVCIFTLEYITNTFFLYAK